MYRRLNHSSNLWIAAILSAILFCLVVAAGGSGGPWRVTTPNAVPPIPHSGGTDVSHQQSTRYLINPDRHVVASTSSDKKQGLDYGSGPDPAVLRGGVTLPGTVSEKQFVSVAQRALNGNEISGYNARAPPVLI